MKILCLVQLPPPIHGAAVMNKHVVENVLPNSDFECAVISLDFSSSFKEMHGRSVRKALIAFKLLIHLIFKLLFFRPNVIYFTIAPFGVALIRDVIFTFVCRLFRCKILFHLHGTGLSNRTSRLYRWAYHYLFGNNDKLMLLSESLYDDVSAFINRNRCIVLANAVEGMTKYDKEINGKGKVVEILYMANFRPEKGLLTVIDVFSKLVEKNLNIQLRLVGSYTFYWSKKSMKRYLSKFSCDVREKIIVHGPAYEVEKKELLKNANIFFYPSRHDAFPLVVLEALAYGLPVIASTQGAIPEMVEDGKSGYLLEANDVKGYFQILSKLCKDTESRRSMSLSAWERFKDHYSFTVFDRRFIEILKEYDCRN